MTAEPRHLDLAPDAAIGVLAHERSLASPPALAPQRAEAARALAALALPSRRVEEYRYTDLRAAVRAFPMPAPVPDAAAVAAASARLWDFAGLARHRIVFVDGRYAPGLSDLAGIDGAVEIAPLAGLLESGDPRLAAVGAIAGRVADPILAQNVALWDDGALITVAAGATVAAPIAIVHLTSVAEPASIHVRHCVSVGEGATVRFLEHHAGPEGVAYLTNTAIELDVARDARVTWARLQEEGRAAIHFGTLVADLGAEAQLDHLSVAFGAALSRTQGFARYGGGFARAAFEAAILVDGRRHTDHTLVVDHAVPDGASRERFRSVVADDARSVVQGRILVAPKAQRTDARMMTQAILTGDGAEMINKPELEIFADDVQCAHGATSGKLDETALFYMRTRGIPRPEAEALLLEAFLAEAIEGLGDEEIAEALKPRLAARLAGTEVVS